MSQLLCKYQCFRLYCGCDGTVPCYGYCIYIYPCGVGIMLVSCDVSGGVLDYIVNVMEPCCVMGIVHVSVWCGYRVGQLLCKWWCFRLYCGCDGAMLSVR